MMVRSWENAEHYFWGQECEGFRLLAREDLSVIEERIPPGAGEVSHFHAKARQLFYVLSGALSIQVETETFVVRQRESLEVPPGSIHCVRNPYEADARFLVISSPSTQGDRTNTE